MSAIEVKVPDIGDFKDVPVIDVLVKPGDTVNVDDSLITLESDKATMDVPAPSAGIVKELRVRTGDKVSEGSVVLTLEPNGAREPAKPVTGKASAPPPPAAQPPAPRGEKGRADMPGEGASATPPAGATIEVRVPDIGDFKDVPVIEVFVKAGDVVKADDPLVTLESDKATMDVRRPVPRTAPRRRRIPPMPSARSSRPQRPRRRPCRRNPFHPLPRRRCSARKRAKPRAPRTHHRRCASSRASSAPFVKQSLAGGPQAAPAAGGAGLNLLAWPTPDFAKFGPVETTSLSRIRKISGANLARNWVMIPHVTQFDDADITDLEAFRVALNKEHEKAGIKVTMLAFLIKASVAALVKFPDFNASLDASGENLIHKRYFNVGFAADTPNGLVVPVIKAADQKGVLQIAQEMSALSAKAREGKLAPADMQGGCFSISSLGGIGGTMFTPIINAPEVAILGVSRSAHKPVWDGKAFAPRLILPLSLSYDHRVIDGAQAARFITYFSGVLADFRRVTL
jgi:pyruvate dehydrogenase E2 component (dihydrolipoamide acetyltransferase)